MISYYIPGKPEWCSEPFCFVDETKCDVKSSESVYFSGLYYSYATCGAFQDVFNGWYNNERASLEWDKDFVDLVRNIKRRRWYRRDH